MTATDEIERGYANQRRAADPDLSVWVSANAGAGKTHVLTARIVNLLLRDVRPSAILCLTFTKAAAAEMRERLAKLLAEWAICDDASLREALIARIGRAPEPHEMARARVLFASVLEAPGGLRVQTIHAFCESLLKRFPLEARVPPHFSVADDAAASALMDEARADLARDPALAEALAIAAKAASETGIAEALDRLLFKPGKLRALEKEGIERAVARMRAEFGLAERDTAESLIAAFVAGLDGAALRAAAGALAAHGGKTDKARAAAIGVWLDGDRGDPSAWLEIFLTEKGAPRATLATKAAAEKAPDALAALSAEQARAAALHAKRLGLETHRRSASLLRLAMAARAGYAARKARAALLDYDDLIERAVDLLESGAAWVLYKLDGGIDHVLVDEAQDTAPAQWRAVRALTGEYYAGASAVERPRTVFVVGDGKQSIFSFQGADLDAFEATREEFAARAGRAWAEVPLQLSFRSAPAVLDVVDRAFESDEVRAGVSRAPIRHLAKRGAAGGRVELWKPFVADDAIEHRHWELPVDYESTSHPSVRLATAIAAALKAWIGRETLPALGRAMAVGDVLILVRRRDRFFEAMVKALKRANVPVAGADRLVLGAEIAVMDLLALARFCLQPSDDLALAEALKSPLLGFDDEDLFALARARPTGLWKELRTRAQENPRWRRAADLLASWRARADFAAPYEFFAFALESGGGRRAILARLGPDAADPLDEFLARCLSFEAAHPPSLQGFLAWFDAGGAQVKRDMEAAHGQVRVMTVHGAKGLEAPVVFLPDTCRAPLFRGSPVWGAEFPYWWPNGGDALEPCARAKEAALTREIAEYKRLLYVAATRARDRLIVCGWTGKKPQEGSWYEILRAAVESHGEKRVEMRDEVEATIIERSPTAIEAAAAPDFAPRAPAAAPAWVASNRAPEESDPPKPLVPSREDDPPASESPLRGARALALKRGVLVHRLLQTLPDLPADRREDAASRFLARPGHGLDPAMQAEIARETLALFDHPEFAAAWAGEGLAEAAIVARIGGRALSGRIDRVVVRDDAVYVLDYKTNRPPPARIEDVPLAYVRQLAAYAAALGPLYPDRPIRAALIWTFAPKLQEIPAELLAANAP
jgi:ATP-dependent helicase/nuclease subunit A